MEYYFDRQNVNKYIKQNIIPIELFSKVTTALLKGNIKYENICYYVINDEMNLNFYNSELDLFCNFRLDKSKLICIIQDCYNTQHITEKEYNEIKDVMIKIGQNKLDYDINRLLNLCNSNGSEIEE